jgi:hypothetical protein
MHALRFGRILCILITSALVAAPQRDPTPAYAQRVQATLTDMAKRTLQGRPELLKAGSLWLTCRIGLRGNVLKVSVLSRHPVPAITETFTAALKSAKFPPIPRAVIEYRGDNFIDVTTHIAIDE